MSPIDAPPPRGPGLARTGPGLAKTRGDRLFVRRAVEMWTSTPGAIAAYMRTADVVSEGETRDEAGRQIYYGSTSFLFLPDARTQSLTVERLCAHLESDPHARLHAVRIAVREAAHRAAAPLGPASAELTFRASPRGVVVTVDVTVPLGAVALEIA